VLRDEARVFGHGVADDSQHGLLALPGHPNYLI
jgi:hypothetical protein